MLFNYSGEFETILTAVFPHKKTTEGKFNMKKNTTLITRSALIAALYVALTYISNLLGLASGVIQVRFSEALTVLPAFTFASVPGLCIGCFVANLITGEF